MSTLTAKLTMLIDGRETLGTGVAGASDKTITFDQYKLVETLKAGTTVPVTTIVSGIQTLSSGTLTIDLTALTGANGAVDATGLKLQVLFIKNLGAATLEVDVGSAEAEVQHKFRVERAEVTPVTRVHRDRHVLLGRDVDRLVKQVVPKLLVPSALFR